jgi:hypothetical protein
LGVRVIRETILVGPGKSVGGEKLPLLVIGVRPGNAPLLVVSQGSVVAH